MSIKRKKFSFWKKVSISFLILLLLAGIVFQVFISRYLPPLVKQRLNEVIVTGSDSLYNFEVGKFIVNFWGGTVRFTDLHITIDSARYKKINDEKKLPSLTFNLDIPEGYIKGIGIPAIVLYKKINIREIGFLAADAKVARHFKTLQTKDTVNKPLWKLILPDIRSINIDNIQCAGLKVNYQNIDSAADFRWQFDKCNVVMTDIRVDSVSAQDSSRLLFAKNVAFTAKDIKMKTPDGLYQLQAKEMLYSSAKQSLQVTQFDFLPAVSEQQLIKHFGFQHEIYKLKIPDITLQNFMLPGWISTNTLIVDTVKLTAPAISLHLDRNAPPYPYSKKGKYPHQLLQKAPFTIQIKRVIASDASVTYAETNDKTQLTGKIVFSSLRGIIDNITNDSAMLIKNNECVVTIKGTVMNTGNLQSVFRFNLTDRNGAFDVNATITDLDAKQLQPLFKAMTTVDLRSFNMRRIDYRITGNEDRGRGTLRMKYDNMDILLNKVEDDKSFKKKGFLSFLVNWLAIYNENPSNGEERKAENVVVQRDMTRSFFNLVWKTLFTSAGEIVLKPVAQRKLEKRKEKAKK